MPKRTAVRSPLSMPPLAQARGVAEADDWSLLLRAVMVRLSQCVDDDLNLRGDADLRQQAGRARAGVRDCVQALEQLHAMLAGTLECSRQRELQSCKASARPGPAEHATGGQPRR